MNQNSQSVIRQYLKIRKRPDKDFSKKVIFLGLVNTGCFVFSLLWINMSLRSPDDFNHSYTFCGAVIDVYYVSGKGSHWRVDLKNESGVHSVVPRINSGLNSWRYKKWFAENEGKAACSKEIPYNYVALLHDYVWSLCTLDGSCLVNEEVSKQKYLERGNSPPYSPISFAFSLLLYVCMKHREGKRKNYHIDEG